MKAFKGCVNQECVAYKKNHYKDEDGYCTKCGKKLQYVCADCWKQLETNNEKYCVTCKAGREDKKDQRVEKVKGAVKKVGEALVAAGPIMAGAAKNAKQIENIVKEGGRVVKMIAKK